jgi:hypothetical protein
MYVLLKGSEYCGNFKAIADIKVSAAVYLITFA